MSLSSALSVALTGLQVATAQMQLVSNNISNANTKGYTEKSVSLSSTVLGTDDGGVAIATYTRATNSVLTQSLNAATSDAAYSSTQNGYMQQVQSILNSNADNPALSDDLAQFSAAWTQLQTSPEDGTVQQAVIQAGNTLAKQINTIAGQVGALKTQTQNDIQTTITQLNTALKSVNSLNQQILTAHANNQPTGDLEDERDQAINTIAAITNVTVLQRSNDQVALYTPSGQSLLDVSPQTFTYSGTTVVDSSGLDVTNNFVGGSLQAEIQFSATAATPSLAPGINTIQKLQAQLGDLVKAFTANSAGPPQTFANAYNPANTAGANFFTATANDPSTFAVSGTLLSGATTIPQANVSATAATFSNNYNFSDSSAALNVPSSTYTGLGTAILSGFQQAANTISNQSQSATSQQTYYQQSLANSTGVNVDSELVNLTTLQNSYAASAHVISTISQMFSALMATIS